jgi:hypothetical protein
VSPYSSVVFALAASAFVACAPAKAAEATAPTTTTGAEVSSASPEGSETARTAAPAPASREASNAAADDASQDAPRGQLVCRTKSLVDGTSELYLEWNAEGATGTLRRVAPSGMVYVQPVKAQRYKTMILVDEPSSEDLVTHAAVVASQNGKQHMRVGDADQRWTTCE